jgi:hypothetical protein
MKNILLAVLCLFISSCNRNSTLHLPKQIIAITGTTQLGDKLEDVKKEHPQLIENEELSDYTSSIYYERIRNNPDFTGISYEFAWGKLSSITLSKDADSQDISLDKNFITLMRAFQETYGKNYTIYQRNHGIMKIPALCWFIPDKGYIAIYYVPYKLFKQHSSKYQSVPNEIIIKFSTTQNKWLEKNQIYTKNNLGLDTL